MESDHAAASPLSPRRLPLAGLAGLLVVWSVAWSTPAGRIAEDTKNDLYVDAWGLMRRALHLWDPQVTWGMLQNQGYGYLFPMGPFFAIGSAVLPVWVVQRVWWSLWLGVGYLATLALLRALRLGPAGSATPALWAHLGALSYVLAPRVLSSMAAISPEAQCQLLAPLILLPLVRATAGAVPARRAAAYSGLAILLCGGVNATATILAALPAGLWLLTRRHWWRAPLTWWWALAAVAASAWWLGPLLVLGRYSPPFLDWIETAAAVTRPVGLLDVFKGTTHWLGHVLVPGGAWWPAGWAIADDRAIVLASSLIAGLGLAGLALPSRHRRFLLLTLLTGVAVLALPHTGPLDSPVAAPLQRLLDGPLAPLRNVHKADPLIRLPLVIGLVMLGGRLAGRARLRLPAAAAAALAVVVVAAPAMSGQFATRGTFTGMPGYWASAGRWLSEHADEGGALLLPSASFAEYTWGRTIDEPMRSLTTAQYAVRDAVPLTPAGTVRFLDEIERRAQSGRDLRGAVAALRQSGVKFLLLRGDLDTALTGGPPVLVTRSALLDAAGVARVAAFGTPRPDLTGDPVAPVEIYALDGAAAAPLTLWPAANVRVVSGASEALPLLRESALVAGPVVFDGDAPAGSVQARIETDTFRARHRFFGAVRGQDASRGLTAHETQDAPDYLPWPALPRRSVTGYGGIAGVRANCSVADRNSLVGLRPADRPYAAIDDDPLTAWLCFAEPRPALTLDFGASRRVTEVTLTPPSAERYGSAVAGPTRVRVQAGATAVLAVLDPRGGAQAVTLPATDTDRLTITILDTARSDPGTVSTGLAGVAVPGVLATEHVRLPTPATTGRTAAVAMTRDPAGFDGCARTGEGFQCLGEAFRAAEETRGLRRQFTLGEAAAYDLSGTLVADPLHPSPQLAVPGVRISASSNRSLGLAGRPESLLDGDPATAWSPAATDAAPSITLDFDTARPVGEIRFTARAGWLLRHGPLAVEVLRDGRSDFTILGRDGRIQLPARPTSRLTVRLLNDAGTRATASLEATAVDLHGTRWPARPTGLGAACGRGPRVTVNGHTVPTAVVGEARAALGVGALAWLACRPVDVGAGTVQFAVAPWRGFAPATVVLREGPGPVAGSAQRAGVALAHASGPGGRMTATVAAGPERLLATLQNANPGWRATLGGRELIPQTIDGFRQGFVVPDGASGPLLVEFAPDRGYRLGLLAGGLLAALLLAGLVAPAGAPAGPLPPARAVPRGGRRLLTGAVTLVAGAAIAALAGLAVAAACLVLAAFGPRLVPAASLALLVLAGSVHALAASGTSPGPPAVEIVTRLATLAALLAVVAVRAVDERPLDQEEGRAGEQHGDRDTDRQ